MLNVLILVISFHKYLVYLLPKVGLIEVLLKIRFSSLILLESVQNFSLTHYLIMILYSINSFCKFLFERIGDFYFRLKESNVFIFLYSFVRSESFRYEP